MESKIIKVYEIEPDAGNGMRKCTEKRPQDLLIWFEEAYPGEKFIVKVSEMTEHEYDNLPEYMGP